MEIGEDELRNEHDFYIVNMLTSKLIQGRFIITRFKIVFVPYEKQLQHNEFFRKFLSVELHLVEKVSKYFNKKHPDQFYLDIMTKDFRQLRIIPRSYPNMDEIYNNIMMILFPSKYSSGLFAFKYQMVMPKVSPHDKQIIEKMMQVVPELKHYSKLPTDGWKV